MPELRQVQLLVQGDVTIAEGGIPVILAPSHFDLEVMVKVVNFLRSGCPAVQIALPSFGGDPGWDVEHNLYSLEDEESGPLPTPSADSFLFEARVAGEDFAIDCSHSETHIHTVTRKLTPNPE